MSIRLKTRYKENARVKKSDSKYCVTRAARPLPHRERSWIAGYKEAAAVTRSKSPSLPPVSTLFFSTRGAKLAAPSRHD